MLHVKRRTCTIWFILQHVTVLDIFIFPSIFSGSFVCESLFIRLFNSNFMLLFLLYKAFGSANKQTK